MLRKILSVTPADLKHYCSCTLALMCILNCQTMKTHPRILHITFWKRNRMMKIIITTTRTYFIKRVHALQYLSKREGDYRSCLWFYLRPLRTNHGPRTRKNGRMFVQKRKEICDWHRQLQGTTTTTTTTTTTAAAAAATTTTLMVIIIKRW